MGRPQEIILRTGQNELYIGRIKNCFWPIHANNVTIGFSDGTGPYFLYGIKGSAIMLLNETIEIGVDLGYEGFTHEQEYDFGLGTVTYSGSGAHVALIVGMAF